jgi:hypothetical protein
VLHDVARPTHPQTPGDEDPLRARRHEAVHEVLRERAVDLGAA